MKQSGSGSRYSHSTEVVVNSKVVPTKQYAKSLSDQSHSEITSSEPPSGKLPEHPGIVGDPGVRECPSGASSPGGTPNNTLGKSAKVSYHYDPLAASDSESKLMRHSGVHQPPQDGLETQSDSNLLNYPQYGGGGGVAMGRGHVGGQAKVVQKPQKSGGGVRGTIRNWESRGSKPEGERVDGMLPTRVLHLPISSSAKRGGEQNMATPNGYTTGGGKGEGGREGGEGREGRGGEGREVGREGGRERKKGRKRRGEKGGWGGRKRERGTWMILFFPQPPELWRPCLPSNIPALDMAVLTQQVVVGVVLHPVIPDTFLPLPLPTPYLPCTTATHHQQVSYTGQGYW